VSQDNVERMRHGYEVFNATSEIDLDLWAPDVEYIQSAEVDAGETVFHGREGVARAVGELTDVFEDLRLDPERFFDLGDRVVALVRLRGRSKASGVPVDTTVAHVAIFREAQITRWRAYARQEEALEAEGIREGR
jgi:ketosteroid isomerase-like protein